eukprot:3056116-Rhodomonas_salina.1
MALPQDRPTVVAVTAGRAGLHANTIRAYKDNAAIRAVIYDACNNPTLARDMLTFLSGPDPILKHTYTHTHTPPSPPPPPDLT